MSGKRGTPTQTLSDGLVASGFHQITQFTVETLLRLEAVCIRTCFNPGAGV